MKSIAAVIASTLLELLASKKGVVWVTNMLVIAGTAIGGLFGYEVDPVKVGAFVVASSAWLIGQGIQDHGEAAARVNMESVAAMDATMKPMAPVNHET